MRTSSDSEHERMERAERMVRAAIDRHEPFHRYRSSIKVYAKGSYANQTNVRADSDVDVAVENHDLYYYEYCPRDSAPSPDPYNSPYEGRWNDEGEWRSEVTTAIRNYFGYTDVDTAGEVALTIAEVVGSRPSADIVPSFALRRFDAPDRSIVHHGSRVWKKSGGYIDNFPNQQLENGRTKNRLTNGRYKKYVRALKNAENFLCESGTIDDLPSYFMECLVWNVPNDYICTGASLDEGFRITLAYLVKFLGSADYVETDWEEPNRLKYLFRGQPKWTPAQGQQLVLATRTYLGYGA